MMNWHAQKSEHAYVSKMSFKVHVAGLLPMLKQDVALNLRSISKPRLIKKEPAKSASVRNPS